MSTATVEYLGNLRTKCVHTQSGTEIFTDAPKDNNGKGEMFSPTDLVATSYASCMITIIGVYCMQNQLEFKHAFATVKKIMGSSPRKISEIQIQLDISNNGWSEIEQKKILNVAKACPVAKSVHEDIIITFDVVF